MNMHYTNNVIPMPVPPPLTVGRLAELFAMMPAAPPPPPLLEHEFILPYDPLDREQEPSGGVTIYWTDSQGRTWAGSRRVA